MERPHSTSAPIVASWCPALMEQPPLALITELRQAQLAVGETGLRGMAAALTEAGHRPRRGDTWHPGRIVSRAAFVTPVAHPSGFWTKPSGRGVRLAVLALRALVLALRALVAAVFSGRL